MELREFLAQGFVLLDGATGSNLQQAGMQSGECPEQWIVNHSDIFIDLQKQYIEAGSDVLYTPTFTCNRIKLEEYGLAEQQEELTAKLVSLTKEAIRQSGTSRRIYIAGDISMTGQQLEPVGSLPFEELVDIYKEEAALLAKEGVDGFVIETMMSLQECRAALLAVKETCDLPVLVTLTYQEDGRTLYGTSPETAAVVLQAMGADAIGINCSTGPDKMLPAVQRMAEVLSVPIIVKPNAGLPALVDGVTCYDMGAEEFAEAMLPLVEAGASILGGCCGTTAAHIRQLKEAVAERAVPERQKKRVRALSTERNLTPISLDGSFMIVGERINPTGKKALQAELREGRLDMVLDMAEEQVVKGARILDVNMGMNGIDEKEMMLKVVQELTLAVDVPLAIDSSYVEVVEQALRIYPGRALVNSISLEKEKFEKLIPVAKKYGAMFILLPLSEEGLPKDIEEKKQIIHTILEEARRHGMSEEDIVVDGLVATIGANKKAALEVLETIRYCKEELGLATICGLSNISFGLPERVFVNTAFLTLAIGQGLTMAIANPSQTLLTNAALAADLLLNKEEADLRYINGVAEATVTQAASGKAEMEVEGHPLYMSVVKGKGAHIVELVEDELKTGKKPAEIIDTHLIPAINYVGELFEQKKYFLPQLIASAETMEKAIGRLEPLLEKERGGEKLDTIVIATVKGDIHDIGKNLVVLMLKNYGYDVIDLGKDVETQQILDTAKETGAAVIGLSALMTTTMMEMKQVVEQARKQGVTAKIIIGGAVVTESFAKEIGADGYSADAREAVKLVNRLLDRKGQ
ncbi:MAG: homocysteine S-methyltransferase family protein [Lachnospiraceae bacterium]|nr:homocysteine S-methyltransferase family protein [Lachnospiraceae bacterium]